MTHRQPPRELPERRATIRAALRAILHGSLLTAREISARVGIPEKDVAEHLEHLGRSLRQSDDRLEIRPPWCHACGFVFKDRTRLDKPSRCPRCKGHRLAPARYGIVPVGGGRRDEPGPDGT